MYLFIFASGELTLSPETLFHKINFDRLLAIDSDQKGLLVGTDRLKNIPAFNLVTSVDYQPFGNDGFVRIRFEDDGVDYYELRILPQSCQVDILLSGSLIYSQPMNRKICLDSHYFIEMSVNKNSKLTLGINRYDPLMVTLPTTLQGVIKIAVNLARAKFDFFVVTVPN